MYIEKKELLNALKNKYGDLTDTSGCNVFVEHGVYEWLSVADIVELIEECPSYEECENDNEIISALDTTVDALNELRKEKEQDAMHYEKRIELLQEAIITLTKGRKDPLNAVRVPKADFLKIYHKALDDMDNHADAYDTDIYGYDFTVHWHGIYCNCGDGAIAYNNIIPGIEGVLEEDPTEY